MATYQFKCKKCAFIFEEDMPMAKASSHHYGACPECAEPHSPRYYGQMNFICKGEGWPSKNIRRGKAPTSTAADRGLAAAKKLEDVQNARVKAGMPTQGKKAGQLSEPEVKERKQNIHDWIDQGEK